MDATFEVLTEDGGDRRNRKLPDIVKARIVAETFAPGATVAAAAQLHGVKANHLPAWRRLARKGKPVLPEPEDEVEFAAMVMAAPLADAEPSVDEPVDIIVGAVTIRLDAATSAARIAAIAHALAQTA
ncbi:transposase [Primorskyibacter sp. 2E107]|uniref:transposase n=1 Tax=Primorskyibacter sp. 2E107 TaxID=3403458 RepID=UPI003AF70DD7